MPFQLPALDTLELPLAFKEWLSFPAAIIVSLPLLLFLIKQSYGSSSSRVPKPPGPRRWPIIGNLPQMLSAVGKEPSWKVYAEWRKRYGDLVYMEAAGQKLLVLNSLSAVDALLNKRATNYSDRIESTVLYLSRHQWSFGFVNYGTHWKEQRRTFHQFFNPDHVRQPEIRGVIDQEESKFLKSLLEERVDYDESLKLLFGRIIMRLSYGMDMNDEERTLHHINVASLLASDQVSAIQPGRYLVGLVPWLRYIPAWFPGTGWKKELEDLGRMNDRVLEEPFEELKERLRGGSSNGAEPTPNIATQLIGELPSEDSKDFAYKYETARAVSATAYAAGVDTTLASARALVLALAMYPEVQRKAQAYIDAELGESGSRLPTWSDLDKLPYVRAILEEVGRWHTVLPLCLPHVSREDDIYEGYHIPANTAILPNTWAIMHDPANFDHPFEFNPERYLGQDGNIDPTVLSPDDGPFGYGRRSCPGRYLSRETLGITAISLLACFDISPAVDENGQPKPLALETTVSTLCAPLPFDVVIKPRSLKHADLISEL